MIIFVLNPYLAQQGHVDNLLMVYGTPFFHWLSRASKLETVVYTPKKIILPWNIL